jgi:hypothetical protein
MMFVSADVSCCDHPESSSGSGLVMKKRLTPAGEKQLHAGEIRNLSPIFKDPSRGLTRSAAGVTEFS